MLITSLKQVYENFRDWRYKSIKNKQIKAYINNERKPWSVGYELYKKDFIYNVINDASTLEKFRNNQKLSEKYGEFLDERVVEYPWFLSRVDNKTSKILDAGSILNYDYVLKHDRLCSKAITIVTLEPEPNCYWENRISYVFGDLRQLDFKDNCFDEVVSLSTIEHIGMNNSIYSDNEAFQEKKNLDFLLAVKEFKRVTKPGGKVYISVPYGKYTDFGWYQQFTKEMIDQLIATFAPSKLVETYYCYEAGGWSISDKEHCQDFAGFNIHDTKYFNPKSTKDYDPDYAACSRAIAALELWK
ncbi:methyltransferase domain-containing protein [Synechocystis sp. PCC 7509]|uniref:methyltransferase domain-containing protein n=1 Tax=Synechocystis sp. PCC 7509 TaxID=927677 RepID=UPI0002AC98DD|nr:methyltransferase domain-containing protein [Synechocystis sp. PCC 7509]